MEFGLRKIVLIDSYVEGMASELDVSGHTNISGGNGKGKTTFLRLIPIFYGEAPRNLVTASGNGNASFNDWYLPRSGSYIVFEYMSHGTPRMVVFCNRANEARHRHVFIDSEYREDLFMDVENGIIHPAHALLTRLSAANLHYLNVDTTQSYRQILLDGTVPKAYHYSMCPRNSRMSQLTPLFTGMFKRNAQFADLSKVIQEYAMDKLDDDSRKILRGFSPHRDHLTATLKQYDAYQALERIKPDCDALQSLVEEYQMVKKQLSASVLAAKSIHSETGITIRGFEQEIQATENAHDDQGTEYQNEHSRLGGLIDGIDDQLGPKVTERNRIEREYKAYQDMDLPEWEQRLSNLGVKQEELGGLVYQHETLSSASKAVEGPINSEIAKVKDRAGELLRKLQKSFERESNQYQESRNNLITEHTNELRDQMQLHQKEESAQQKTVNDYLSDIRVLEERLENPRPDAKLGKQLEIAQENYDTSQKAFQDTQQKEAEAHEKLRKARKHYEDMDRRFEASRTAAEKVEEELLEVQGLISGDESTLIHFLNEHRPGWENNIGRILQPDILRRKNLSPAIDEEHTDAHSLFGVSIDFEKLPDQELTPEELTARLSELEESFTQAERECASTERDLEQANTRLSEAQKLQENATEAFKQATRRLKTDSAMLEQIRQQVDQSIIANKRTLETQLDEARQGRGEAEAELKTLSERQSAEAEQLSETQQGALERFDTAHKDKLKGIADAIEAAERNRDDEIDRLNRQLEQALSEKGIDPAELKALAEQRQALKKEIDEIQAKEITIQGYRSFMAEDYAALDGLKAGIRTLEKKKQEHEDEQKRLTKAWQKRSDDLNSTIQKLKKDKEGYEANRDALKLRILDVEEGRELAVHEDDGALALYREMAPPKLIDEYLKLVRDDASLLSRIKKASDQFAVVFERHPGTPSTQYWQELGLDWDGTDARAISRAKAIIEYYRGGKHGIVFESLVKGFGNLDQIDIYRRAMENFDRRIRRFNRELSQHMAQSLTFKSLSSIEPTVSFELEDLDYWKDIRSLSDGVRAWRDEGGINSMPGDELVRSLRSYLETFEVSRSNVPVDELWRLIRFRFTVVENGKTKTVTGNRDLSGEASVSSNGLSYLVLIVVFLGFVDMQRNGQPVHLSWALDELRAFDNDNRRALLELLSRHDINLVTACPDMEDRDLGIFHRVYKLEDYKSGLRFVRWTMPPAPSASATNPFLEVAE